MPNLIGFLILVVIVFIGAESDLPSNPLTGAGTLIIMAYLLSLAVKRLRLPAAYGFIAAGLLAGDGGLGLLSDHFLPIMSLPETIAIMLLMFAVSRQMARPGLSLRFIRNAASGALMSACAFGVTTVLLMLLTPLSLETAVPTALFAATFSPITLHAFGSRDDTNDVPAQAALGSLFTVIALWGIIIAVMNPSLGYRFRIALMPGLFAVTSIAAGLACGLAGEFVYKPMTGHDRSFLPFMLVFLMIPLTRMAGLDYMFAAAGLGIYFGGASTLNIPYRTWHTFALLTAFALFGAKLPFMQAVLLDRSEWAIILTLTAVTFIVRTGCTILTLRHGLKAPRYINSSLTLIPFGPASLICLDRFLPAFRGMSGPTGIPAVLRYCMITTLFILFITATLQFFSSLREKPEKSKTDIQENTR